MEQWKGKVAVVTGASAGIGEAICKDLCKHGVIVVGMARRLERLEQLKQKILDQDKSAKFHSVKCDLNLESDIKTAFDYVCKTLGGVDILVNNAGVARNVSFFAEDNLDQLKTIIETNLVSVVSSTKKAFKSMSDRDVPGYIINISSVAGHYVPNFPGGYTNVYPSSKHGLKALAQMMRYELNTLKKNNIRISTISPGAVKTEIFEVSGFTMDGVTEFPNLLEPEDVSDTVLYLLGTNPSIQVEDVIIRPTGETL